MKIQRITDSHRQDFRAIMECEHCGATCELTTGYNDNNYHSNVIPAMKCKNCGLSRNDPSAARPVEATMPEITQADREAAKELIHRKWYGFSVAAYEEVFCQAFAQHREAAEAAKAEGARAERDKWLAACSRVSRDSAREESDETFHEGRMTACSAIVQLATTGNDTANKEPRR